MPEGTELKIRLRQFVASHSSSDGTAVRAMVIEPVSVGGRLVIPMGSELDGAVTAARRVGFGFLRERAFLQITFDRLRLPDGREWPLALRITRVDDARESVDANGRIIGIRATSSFASSLSGLATAVGVVDPMLLAFTTASSLSAFRIPESEIVLPAGTELRARLLAPLPLTSSFPPAVGDYRAGPVDRGVLADLVQRLPYRTATEAARTPSDITNLMFVGSRAALAAAFDAAGWGETDPLNARSKYLALRAIIENQGYRDAPMSTLVLDGRRPELTYAKTLNTFFERHHLRIFGTPATLDGQPVWTSSSTHDSGIGFSVQRKTLIHVIDENIDEERDKVVNDLTLTGCVDGVAYVDRPWLPDELSNSTGDRLRTDKRIAVMRLNECARPARADQDVTVGSGDAAPGGPGSGARRGLRNAVLMIKNDLWRGNLAYQAYALTRLGIGILRRKDTPLEDRTIALGGETFKIVRGTAAGPDELFEEVVSQDEEPGFDPVGAPRRYDSRLLFSFAGSTSVLGGTGVGTLRADVGAGATGTGVIPLALTARLRPDWGFTARVTLGSWRHVSQEFSFVTNQAAFDLKIASPREAVIDVATGAQLRQFGYTVLLHPLPNGRRLRPYGAIGPVLQMISLDDAVIEAGGIRRFGLKSVGFIASAWNFGTTPPLEGGGLFQMGVQYGAGVKFNLTPTLVLRGDYRETLAAQPDLLTRSADTLRAMNMIPGPYTIEGKLRLRQLSVGLGIGF